MNTREASPGVGTRQGSAPASRIVRITHAAWPAAAGAAVLAAVLLAVPHEAWLPFAQGRATEDAWQALLAWPQGWLAHVQTTVGARLWSVDPVAGAIVLAATAGAVSAGLLAVALRATGLPSSLAALLALVAASAPFGLWQASSPLGAAPASLVSALLLLWMARPRMTRAPVSRVLVVGGVLVVVAAALSSGTYGVRTTREMWAVLRGDLGWLGLVLVLVLLLAPVGRGSRAGVRPLPILQALTIAALLSTPMTGAVRAAIVLPWAWWLAGAGLAELLALRGRHAGRWAAAGLLVWLGLHAGRVPWGHQRQQAALARTWADGIARLVSPTQPLVDEDSARGRLVAAVAGATTGPDAAVARLARHDVPAVTARGRRPVVIGVDDRESLRWDGVALDELPADTGVALDRVLEALPAGTIVAAALSRDAAAQLTPAHWQALGRVGLRLVDAGVSRPHALVGVTRARVEALEVAQPGTVRLAASPGDPVGRTGVRSPVDVRLEADGTRVRVFLRDRPFLGARGLALLFFTTRGDLLAWRTGVSPLHLDGAPLGPAPARASIVSRALPCLDLPAGQATDVTAVALEPALGLTLGGAGQIDVRITRPEGFTTPAALAPLSSGTQARPVGFSATPTQFSVDAAHEARVGVNWRGPVARAVATSTVPARLCAAWPSVPAIDPTAERIDMPMGPDMAPHLGGGWHDIETSGEHYFRWMAGPRAEVLVALQRAEPFTFSLDAQAPLAPVPGDHVRLVIAGRDLGGQPLLPTRGIYAWDVPADAVRAGVNAMTIGIARTARPAQGQDGGDARQLGLLVRGWAFGPPTPR